MKYKAKYLITKEGRFYYIRIRKKFLWFTFYRLLCDGDIILKFKTEQDAAEHLEKMKKYNSDLKYRGEIIISAHDDE